MSERKPTKADAMLELQREMLFQLKALNRVHDGVMRFPYRDSMVSMHLPFASSDLEQRELVNEGTFCDLPMLEVLARYIKKGSLVLDIGSNIGNHAVFFGLSEAAKVIAVEPQDWAFRCLEDNAADNGLAGKIECFNCIVGEKSGYGRIECSPVVQINTGGVRYCTTESPDGAVEMLTVDELASRYDLPVSLMKIDVEGMQLDVLKGAEKTVDKWHPAIFVELLPGMQQHTEKQWNYDNEVRLPKRWLTDHGYALKPMTQKDWLAVKAD